MLSIPHICQGHQGRCPWRKKLSCGEICPHDRLSGGEILHMTDCNVEKNSPHEKCEENLKCGEIMCTIYGVLPHVTIFVANSFVL